MRQNPILFATLFAIVASTVHAGDYKVGSLDIVNPWSRATARGAVVAAGYMKITNNGTTPDRLIGGSADVGTFELHEATMDNGIARMRPVTGGLEIKPGETVEFKPEAYHVMFVGLKKPLVVGEHIKATLTFEQAGKVDVEYDVLAMGANPSRDMPGMKHDH